MITSLQLRYGSYHPILPEVYELKEVIENTDWHQENVFNHTVQTLWKIEQLIPNWQELEKIVTTNSRGNLLRLAAVLHDLGKKETLITENNKTKCPGHEEVSAKKAATMFYTFQLSNQEKDRVLEIIRYHGEIHKVIKSDNWQEHYKAILKLESNLELTLLGLADTQASILFKTRPEEYWLRIERYNQILGNKMYGPLAL